MWRIARLLTREKFVKFWKVGLGLGLAHVMIVSSSVVN